MLHGLPLRYSIPKLAAKISQLHSVQHYMGWYYDTHDSNVFIISSLLDAILLILCFRLIASHVDPIRIVVRNITNGSPLHSAFTSWPQNVHCINKHSFRLIYPVKMLGFEFYSKISPPTVSFPCLKC